MINSASVGSFQATVKTILPSEKLPTTSLHCGKIAMLPIEHRNPIVNPIPTLVATQYHVPVCGCFTLYTQYTTVLYRDELYVCACVFCRQKVQKRNVSSLCRPWSSPSRSPCWITLCSGASPTSEWFTHCALLSLSQTPINRPHNSQAEDTA